MYSSEWKPLQNYDKIVLLSSKKYSKNGIFILLTHLFLVIQVISLKGK